MLLDLLGLQSGADDAGSGGPPLAITLVPPSVHLRHQSTILVRLAALGDGAGALSPVVVAAVRRTVVGLASIDQAMTVRAIPLGTAAATGGALVRRPISVTRRGRVGDPDEDDYLLGAASVHFERRRGA